MRKRFSYVFLAALAISCQVEKFDSNQESISYAKEFIATIEDNSDIATKTSLDNNGNVLWKQGDQLSVFAGSTVNEQYQVTDASDGKTAASLNKVGNSGFVAGTEIDNNIAFYPYTSTVVIAKSAGSYIISDITLPASQIYVEGSFGNGAFPMAAVTGSTDDLNLKFKNVLGGLKLQLKGTASIASISVTGNNNEILCGDAEVTVANGSSPSINLTNASAKTVTLDCGAGVALNSETVSPFIIALPPMTMAKGFSVVIKDTNGKQMVISTTKSQTINRSSLLKMPAIDYIGTDIPTPDAIDLGLPSGIKWASFNVGASVPEDYGDYYAWGEIEPKDNYTWGTYKWANGWRSTLTKYNTKTGNGATTPDQKYTLDAEDDIAHVSYHGKWRMPTSKDCVELNTECTWEYDSALKGYHVIGPSGRSIFIPLAGIKNGTELLSNGETGAYWSASLEGGSPNSAQPFDVPPSNGTSTRERIYGCTVRAVWDDNCTYDLVQSISLGITDLQLSIGKELSLGLSISPVDATNQNVLWSSSDPSVATVSKGTVLALSLGTTTITAVSEDGGHTVSCEVEVIPVQEKSFVDLGLSVKWASFNIGASSPADYGNYYSWGEIATKNEYSWATYKFGDSLESLTKYNSNDNITYLEEGDDVSTVELGPEWRLPTMAEFNELNKTCSKKKINRDGNVGILYSKNGTSIFLPYAGYFSSENHYVYSGEYGRYWSRELSDSNPERALSCRFYNTYMDSGSVDRSAGFSVRPVFVE